MRANGRLAYLSIDNLLDNGNISIKLINNLENIVSVVNNHGLSYAVDASGKEVPLYDYISTANGSNNGSSGSYNYNLTKRKLTQNLFYNYLRVIVDTDGNAYLTTTGTYPNDSYIKNNLVSFEKKFKTYSPKNFTDFDGSNSIKAYKLNIDKVLTTYYANFGNGNPNYFVFMKENGTLSYMNINDLLDNGKIDIKNITDLKNIVTVINDRVLSYAVDINGNEVRLYDYVD